MAAPGKGILSHHAAYALRKKLRQLGRTDNAVLIVSDSKDLHDLPKPFLAGIKFSFMTNRSLTKGRLHSAVRQDPVHCQRQNRGFPRPAFPGTASPKWRRWTAPPPAWHGAYRSSNLQSCRPCLGRRRKTGRPGRFFPSCLPVPEPPGCRGWCP